MPDRTRLLALLLLLGCSCGGGSATTPAPSTTPPTSVAPTSASGAPVDVEVHEWGLLRAEAGDVLRIGAVSPPIAFSPMVMEKPVLYFHTSAPTTLRTASVRIEGGSIAESWPFVASSTEARWTDVRLDPTAACAASPLPTAADLPCAALAAGDTCEATGLAVVRAADAACVSVGGTTDGFLFYRARVERFTPPLVFERIAGTDRVRVTNEGDLPIPGELVRIERGYGWARTLSVAPPAPHASIEVGADFDAAARVTETPVATEDLVEEERMVGPSTVTPGQAALRRSLAALGLSPAEQDAFLAAWGDALFGRPGEVLVEQSPPPTTSFVSFLPEARAAALAPLSFDPPVRAVHRAMAVWSVLAASGPSH